MTGPIRQIACRTNQFKGLDELPGHNIALMRIDHAAKCNALSLTTRRLGQQIFILGDKNAAQFAGAIKERRI